MLYVLRFKKQKANKHVKRFDVGWIKQRGSTIC